jgi:hypothetical protein
MEDAICWWSAIISGSVPTVKSLLEKGFNPFETINGQTAEDAVLGFSRKLARMSACSELFSLECDRSSSERLSRYSEIISILQQASREWYSRSVVKRFLRRCISWHRRERLLRACILCKQIWILRTGLYISLGPVKHIQSYLCVSSI